MEKSVKKSQPISVTDRKQFQNQFESHCLFKDSDGALSAMGMLFAFLT